jgi:hypothetical protein
MLCIQVIPVMGGGVDGLGAEEMRELKGDDLIRIFLVQIQLAAKILKGNGIIHIPHIPLKGLAVYPMLHVVPITQITDAAVVCGHFLCGNRSVLKRADINILGTLAENAVPFFQVFLGSKGCL